MRVSYFHTSRSYLIFIISKNVREVREKREIMRWREVRKGKMERKRERERERR